MGISVRAPMAKIKISKVSVDAVEPAFRDEIYWDDRLPGFGLKVTPTGSKVYLYRYRIARPGRAAQTAPRKYTIGRHGELTPDQARKRAQELAALVASGIDPREQEIAAFAAKDEADRRLAEQVRLETDLAFGRVADLWLDHYEHEKGRRPSSVNMAEMVVRRHLKPALGSKPMPYIDHFDLQSVLDAIPVPQRATRRNVFAYASILFGWAAKRRYIENNPLLSMEKPGAPMARDRVLYDGELSVIWRASNEMATPWGPFYRLLILTGQRKSEVAGMVWAELDRKSGVWTIPADRAKNKKVHLVPLTPAAINVLDELADGDAWPNSGFVLTTNGRSSISGFSKAKRVLDDRVTAFLNGRGLPDWRVHDIRRTVATGMQRLGVRFEVTEAILNHVSGAKGGVAGVYQRHDWAMEKASALAAWADHVGTLVAEFEQVKSTIADVRDDQLPVG